MKSCLSLLLIAALCLNACNKKDNTPAANSNITDQLSSFRPYVDSFAGHLTASTQYDQQSNEAGNCIMYVNHFKADSFEVYMNNSSVFRSGVPAGFPNYQYFKINTPGTYLLQNSTDSSYYIRLSFANNDSLHYHASQQGTCDQGTIVIDFAGARVNSTL